MALARNTSNDLRVTTRRTLYGGAFFAGNTLYIINWSSGSALAHTITESSGGVLSLNRVATLDITGLGNQMIHGGISDGTTIWFVNNTTRIAVAYSVTTRRADAPKNIALGTGNWSGACYDGTTLWFVDRALSRAVAYNASTRTADTAKNIALVRGSYRGATSNGNILWFLDTDNPDRVYGYTANDRQRDFSNDIVLDTENFSVSWPGLVSQGNRFFFFRVW